jgi:hypothetical protein
MFCSSSEIRPLKISFLEGQLFVELDCRALFLHLPEFIAELAHFRFVTFYLRFELFAVLCVFVFYAL